MHSILLWLKTNKQTKQICFNTVALHIILGIYYTLKHVVSFYGWFRDVQLTDSILEEAYQQLTESKVAVEIITDGRKLESDPVVFQEGKTQGMGWSWQF